jgi:DNA-binding MarR family transcriptional regulator
MIIRRKHSGNFAVLPNATLNDEQLSADTLGVLAYLLAKPPNWKVSVSGLRARFGIGRDRVYAILKQLEVAGYVEKRQTREKGTSQFCALEYIVYDTPEARKEYEGSKPLPEYQDADDHTSQQAASGFAVSGSAVSGKSERNNNTDSNKPLSEEHSAPDGAGAVAPSVSGRIWCEARALFDSIPSRPNPSIIGKWLKRTPSDDGKEKLLGMIRSARLTGTLDPVAYITASLDREFPRPPDPQSFDRITWQHNARAAIKTRLWAPAWGAAPGQKGCVMPPDLITPELLAALSEARRVA